MRNMKWEGLPENFKTEDWFGFVYLITNLTNNRKYIGRKYFFSNRKGPAISAKRNKRIIKESDWLTYCSSCSELKNDIKLLGEGNFKFQIISLHTTKGDTNYAEVKEQFIRDVLKSKLPNGEREYYNSNILSRYFIPKERGTEEYKKKCENISSSMKKHYSKPTSVHPLKGKKHPSRGKKLPQTGHKLNVGKIGYTNGSVNIKLEPQDTPPEGFYKGMTRKRESQYPIKLKAQYDGNPRLCPICNTKISYDKKANKTCSKACGNTLKILKTKNSKVGKSNPAWRGYYITPAGKYQTAKEASIPNNCSDVTVRNRCKARVGGWSFETTTS